MVEQKVPVAWGVLVWPEAGYRTVRRKGWELV